MSSLKFCPREPAFNVCDIDDDILKQFQIDAMLEFYIYFGTQCHLRMCDFKILMIMLWIF